MSPNDRRATQRFQPKPGNHITYGENSAVIRDLSLEGVFVFDLDPLPIGSEVMFTLRVGDQDISLEGVVRHSVDALPAVTLNVAEAEATIATLKVILIAQMVVISRLDGQLLVSVKPPVVGLIPIPLTPTEELVVLLRSDVQGHAPAHRHVPKAQAGA